MDATPTTCEDAYEMASLYCDSVGPEGVTHEALNGEPYVTLVAGGIKPQGEEFPEWFPTEQAALAAWWQAFMAYRTQHVNLTRPAIICWRTRPESWTHPDHPGFTIFSRLLIV